MSVMKSPADLKDKTVAQLTELWDALDLGIDIHGNPVPVRNPPTATELFLANLLDTPQQRLDKLHQAKVDAEFDHWLATADINDLAKCYAAIRLGPFDKATWLLENPLDKHRREAAHPTVGPNDKHSSRLRS
jgi:hypothetical protein